MTEYLLKDKELGSLHIVVNRRARRIIMRPSDDGLRVTVPNGTSRLLLLDTLHQHADSLKQMQQRMTENQVFIDFDYRIDTDLLQLRLVPGNRPEFYLNRQEGECVIVCPHDTDFKQRQKWLKTVIAEQLRAQAKAILPQRLKRLASEHGFLYERVSIQSSTSRWGSCSGRNTINLSFYLMKLPSHLVDYVLLHELCHTVHHDHSTEFWALMDSVTNHKALTLRRELQGYHTEI